MLDTPTMDALLRLTQRKGALATDRAAAVADVLESLPTGPDQPASDCDCVRLVQAALMLAETDEQVTTDVLLLVAAVRGDVDMVAHARSLLEMAVRAQPAGRRRRAADETIRVRAVGA